MTPANRNDGGLSAMQRWVMNMMYREAAGDPEKLPWHRAEPGAMLVECATARPAGTALDVGSGSGVFSAYLAALGYTVTAIDLHPDAVEMARRLADRGPAFEVRQEDFLQFESDRPFDLIYDSGCLHNFGRGGLKRYVRKLDELLAPDGDFVLEHWCKRGILDWRPIGPYRRRRETIEAAFAPGFVVEAFMTEVFDVPFPIGPTVQGAAYRMRRA